MMENVTFKYILSIARCESIEYIFFCAASILTFYVGYDKRKWAVTGKITLNYRF